MLVSLSQAAVRMLGCTGWAWPLSKGGICENCFESKTLGGGPCPGHWPAGGL